MGWLTAVPRGVTPCQMFAGIVLKVCGTDTSFSLDIELLAY